LNAFTSISEDFPKKLSPAQLSLKCIGRPFKFKETFPLLRAIPADAASTSGAGPLASFFSSFFSSVFASTFASSFASSFASVFSSLTSAFLS
jgi:hypothetical protein